MKRISDETITQKALQKQGPGPGKSRRFERHGCKERPLVTVTVGPEGQRYQAVVRDVSREGIGLFVLRAFEAGTLVDIELQWGEGPCWKIAAEVKHSAREPDESWHIGFHMSRAFTDNEMTALWAHFPATECN